jgi:hypothetical protein
VEPKHLLPPGDSDGISHQKIGFGGENKGISWDINVFFWGNYKL